jgi:transcriptional regulator with XRE-family HTH domain
MPKKPEKKRHLTQLREALGLSQSQFAERLGVSASMIKKVEEGTRPGSDDLKARIYAETGRMFFNRDEPGYSPDGHVNYTKAEHEAWFKEVQFDPKFAAAAARIVLRQVELMLIAAARPGVNKSYQVFNGLLLALERVKAEFHLARHIEAELRDRHSTETRNFMVRELRANRELARLWNFQDDPKLKADGIMSLEKPIGLFPDREINQIFSQHRELISEILKTQAGELSDDAKAKLAALDQKVEREMATFIREVKQPLPT